MFPKLGELCRFVSLGEKRQTTAALHDAIASPSIVGIPTAAVVCRFVAGYQCHVAGVAWQSKHNPSVKPLTLLVKPCKNQNNQFSINALLQF
jgi:hypothetical protein